MIPLRPRAAEAIMGPAHQRYSTSARRNRNDAREQHQIPLPVLAMGQEQLEEQLDQSGARQICVNVRHA